MEYAATPSLRMPVRLKCALYMSQVSAAPYAASTAALCRLEVVPLPQTLSASVNRVPVLVWLVEPLASYVRCPPRVPSVSWYVDPLSVVCSDTVPL